MLVSLVLILVLIFAYLIALAVGSSTQQAAILGALGQM